MSGMRRVARCAALGVIACLASVGARAAPITLPLNYLHSSGDATISVTGSVTYDSAIQVPNFQTIGTTDLTGLIAVSLTVSGPAIPGGSTTFTLADMSGWAFTTNGSAAIVDINFFGNVNGTGCNVFGVEVFLLEVRCAGNPLAVKLLRLGPESPVPALDPALLALVALLLGGSGLLATRRRVTARRRA